MAPCGCSHFRSMNCPPTPPQTQQQPNYKARVNIGLGVGVGVGNLPLYHEA